MWHAIGEAALKHFADVLRSTFRQSDYSGRIGGEEFVVLLAKTTLIEANQFAQRLCAAVQETPLKINNLVISYPVSLGVTELSVADASPEQTLGRADEALYEAKNGGRNRVVSKPRQAFERAVG